jgi:hypothetical protein
MDELSRGRPQGKPLDPSEGGAAVRTPSQGDSSSSGSILPPSDSPTLVDIPIRTIGNPSDSPTLVDLGGTDASDSPTLVGFGPDSPTMIDSGPLPARPTPTAQRFQNNPSMLPPGAILGQRYEILQILGEGGMGAVYKAKDRELNRPVALKVIRPDLAGSQAILDRFKQELLLAREVTHKNVIRIYDIGEADGMKFITMEYVEGEDLRGLMQRKKKLAPEETVEIMQQTCRALEAAFVTCSAPKSGAGQRRQAISAPAHLSRLLANQLNRLMVLRVFTAYASARLLGIQPRGAGKKEKARIHS